jgi:hypothetical protein
VAGVHPAEQRLKQAIGHLRSEAIVHDPADGDVVDKPRRGQLGFGAGPAVALGGEQSLQLPQISGHAQVRPGHPAKLAADQ